jgi:hypothetical protein
MPGLALAAARTLFRQNLANHGYAAGTPAHSIVSMPGRELWNSAMTEPALIAALARNFYHYGRTNCWRWVQTSNGNGTTGGGNLGVPLLRGAIQATNCGGFNGSLRRIAHDIVALNNVTNAGATTGEAFLTSPNLVVIDAAWPGNVRTLSQDFATLGVFFFIGHSWNRLGGDHYDASTDAIAFNGASDLIWCKLVRPPGCRVDAWSVNVTRPPQPYGPAPYLVVRTGVLKQFVNLLPTAATAPTFPGGVGVTQAFVNALPNLVNGWGTLLLVSRSHLSQAFRAAISYP